MTATNIESTRNRLREAMPVVENWAYFDHAAVAPLTAPAAEAIQSWLTECSHQGDTKWPQWAKRLRSVRTMAAEMIHAETDEIALIANTTTGINYVAEGLDWQPGDNVVTLDDEFPSNIYPWMHLERHGVETRLCPTQNGQFDLDELADLCDPRTRVLSISWVGYANGHRRDLHTLGEIAHRHDTIFFVDAIQALGVFPLDVQALGIDALAADGHKWMLGPEGAGVAFLNRKTLDRLQPIGVGWNSVEHAGDFDNLELSLKNSAARYEGGTYNMPGFLGLAASMELLTSLGIENIAAAILDITDRICRALEKCGATILSPRQQEERSGIVTFTLPEQDPQHVRRHCLEQGVALNCRGGGIRLSAHAYNNQADLEKLLAALESCQ